MPGIHAKREREKAVQWLTQEIEKGRRSGEEKGYIPAEEVIRRLEETYCHPAAGGRTV